MEQQLYKNYSDYLKATYHEKVYKLPINLPITCPNRQNGKKGCSFCADIGTGFEALNNSISITEQLKTTRELIERKYNAHKFIAYFQNYTNTYMPLSVFKKYIKEAAEFDDIVEISISTRPDCISTEYLAYLKEIEQNYHISIMIELGLQTANYHTLDAIQRGHGLAEFIDAVLKIKAFGFSICTHVILNLPGDTLRDSIETAKILSALGITIVKIHSLYIAKNSMLCEAYENGTISICSKEEYLNRLMHFIEHLSPDIVVDRLFSRIPESDAVFSNWNTSWWKLKDEFELLMHDNDSYQGKAFSDLSSNALTF